MTGKPQSAHQRGQDKQTPVWTSYGTLCSCYRDEGAPSLQMDGLQDTSMAEKNKLYTCPPHPSPTAHICQVSG